MQLNIPCDVVARFSHVLKMQFPEGDEWATTLRIDNGIAVASNRRIMAVENIGGGSGITHLIMSPALIAQCETETKYNSMLQITITPELKFATCKTSLGYQHPGNCSLWSATPNFLDNWRSVIPKKMPEKSKGGMFWQTQAISDLGRSSPSGGIVFAEAIDVTIPTIVRDSIDPNWFGVFLSTAENKYPPATVPDWAM